MATLCAGLISACTPIRSYHGYAPTDEDLSSIVVRVDTRDTVSELVGQPSASGVRNASGYYYVRSEFHAVGPFQPKEAHREVVAISFNSAGVVANIERFGLEQGQIVTLSRRVTESSVRDTPFLRQLFGNIGRPDTSAILGDN